MKQQHASKSYNDTLPYLYQAEYINMAWGERIRKGLYIDPAGIKYVYSNPNNWNDFTRESNLDGSRSVFCSQTKAVISHDDSYANMNDCRKRNVLFKFLRTPLALSQTIMDDLMKSEVIDYGQMMCDAGLISHSLFIYDHCAQLYRRVLLSCDLDSKLVNQSQYASDIVESLGTIVRR